MVISMAGNPEGTIQSIQKIPHKNNGCIINFFEVFVSQPVLKDRCSSPK